MAKKHCDCDSKGMTLQQWAAAGGDVPKSFKGREKSWANQVKKFAAGGSANSKGKAGDLSVLEMGDMSSPAYRAHLERKQGLEGSYPEAFVAPAVRGAASAVKGFLGNLGKPKPGQLSPGHYEFANAKRDVAMSQLTKQEMDTFYRTGNLPSRFPELLENASVIGSKVGRVPMPKPEKKTLQELLVERVMTPAGRRSAVDLGLNTANQMSDIYDQKGFAPAGGDKAGSYAAGGEVFNTVPDMSDGGQIIDGPAFAGGGIAKLAKSLTGAKKADDAAKTSLGEVSSMVAKMGEEGRSPIIPVPNRWFLQPDKFPHQQKLIERVLATTGKAREDFPSGAFIDPRTGEVLDSRIMNELGVVIDPKTNRPMMTAKGEAGIERIDPKLGAYTKSNLVRKGLFKPEGGDPLLNDLNFLATIEKGDVGHKYGLATEYASPAELFNTGTGANPTLRPRSRGDLFGVGDVVGQVRVGRSEPHDVYEKLFVAPKGSDVQGVKLSKAKGGEVKMADGGAAFGVFPHMKRKRTKQDPEAAKNVPVDLARGFVAGALGMPGDIESLARLPYELITGNESPTILPTSGDIEKRLPFKSDTPVSRLATEAGQLGGGFYTGPGSGARAAMAVPKAIKRAGQDFVMAAPQGAPRMFIGPKAKTWDQAKANAALKMEREGRDPVDIWRETGTFRSADGVLRQEISDVGAVHRNPTQLKELGKQKKEEAAELQQRLTGIPGQKDMFPKALTEAKRPVREKVKTLKEEVDELMRYSDVRGQRAKFALEHPELYKAYPELGEIPVYQGGRGLGSERASLRGGPQDMEMEITQSGLRADPRSSALHEMQHAIQTIEEMGPGGSPTFAFKDPKAYEILEELRKKALEPMSFEEYAKQYSHVPDLQQGYEGYKRAIPRVVKNMENDLQRQAAMEYYTRLAGEAEARATQAREPMSASQRAQEFPYSSYDVLPEDLIVKAPKSGGLSLQTVYHGSPHKFDKFDASKIGTGEGAQAYGRGLYFAESPGVAESYAKNLANRDMNNQGRLNAHANAQRLAGLTGDPKYAADDIRFVLSNEPDHPQKTLLQDTLAFLESGDFAKPLEAKGNLYKVDLPDEKIALMLDYDKAINEQAPEVLSLLEKAGINTQSSAKAGTMIGGQEMHLAKHGIPGIKYLDEASRGASGTGRWLITMKNGEQKVYDFKPNDDVLEQMGATAEPTGTRNFVVFPGEEDALTILERKKEGGEVKMQAGGIAKTLKKLVGPSAEAAAKEASAAERAAAGRMAADVTKATQPMKMSEALGNLNVEGKGKLKVTQSDRTRVGGGNIGGAMFPGLSQVDPLYEGLVWGVGKKPTASSLINQSDDLTYWSTLLGAEDQLKTNPLVFNKLRKGFVDAMKQGKLSPELEEKINKNLALTFGEGAEIRDPKIWQKANTFDKRAALADVMLGQGIPPGKGGVALGGEKSGKGVIFKPTDILKRETEPLLLHPEHGGDVPTFGVGPRLFQFSGGMKVRPDLHPGFPVLLEGQDMGMVFKPAPGEIAMRDFANRMLTERGRNPGYYEWTMGESGKGLPSQLITDEYLTYLQKAGYKKGGKVGGLSQAKNQRKK